MKSLITYNPVTKSLTTSNTTISTICKKYICDNHKKCQKFYMKNIDNPNEKGKFKKCPYGYYCYFGESEVYSSIIIENQNESDIRRKLKEKEDNIKNYKIYSEEHIKNIIEDIEELKKNNKEKDNEIKILSDCTHDLRNIGTYFNSLENQVKNKYPDLYEDDNDFKAMLCMYEMVNYRLSYISKINESDYKIKTMKLHPILEKLRIILSYKARNKDITIKLASNEDYIKGFDNLYLAFFIIIENAIKHSPPDKEIDMYFIEKNGSIIVGVSNYATQVYEDELCRLVERGYRGRNAMPDGNGIGLSIFDGICKKQQIKYIFKSKKINQKEYMFIVEMELEKSS